MIPVVSLLAVVVLAYVWITDRREQRTATSHAADRTLAALRVQADVYHEHTVFTEEMVRRHAMHIDRLVQRIQAPDVAVAAQATVDLTGVPDRQYVAPDDDAGFQADQAEPVFSGQAVDDDAIDWRDFLADRANA